MHTQMQWYDGCPAKIHLGEAEENLLCHIHTDCDRHERFDHLYIFCFDSCLSSGSHVPKTICAWATHTFGKSPVIPACTSHWCFLPKPSGCKNADTEYVIIQHLNTGKPSLPSDYFCIY